MQMPLSINYLELEITRLCNALCDHCFRGEIEDKSMTVKIIKQFLNNKNYKITEIGECLITGGEPFLNKKVLIFFLEYLLQKKLQIHLLDIVTNALIFDKDIMELLQELHNKNTVVSVETKLDQFHPQIPRENINNFFQYPFYNGYYHELTQHQILALGKAYKNKLGTEQSHKETLKCFHEEADSFLSINSLKDTIEIESLYITSSGHFGSYTPEATWPMIDKIFQLSLKNNSLFENCTFRNLGADLYQVEKTNIPFPIESFIEDYKKAQQNGNSKIFLHSITEQNMRNYLLHPQKRVRKRN